MKKRLIATLTVLTFLFAAGTLFAETKADDVLGTWMVPAKDASITITKKGNKFFGKITWMKNPEELDDNNPDPKLRTRTTLGINLLRGFVFDDGEWEKGKIYDPGDGKLYSCIMWMDGNDKLWVKGYIGFSFIGRKEMWTRVKK